jgi:hypothetical protein
LTPSQKVLREIATRPADLEVGLQGEERGLAHGHDAVLGTFARDAHQRGLGVDGLDLQPAELGDAQA